MANGTFKTLIELLSAYDVAGKRFSSHDIVASLTELPNDEIMSNLAQYELLAFRLQPNGSDDNPFGGYYGPRITMSDAQGNPSYIPSYSSITPDAVKYWEQRYKTAHNSLLKMRYAGLVWDFKVRVVNQSYDNDLYRTYVDAMLDVCDHDYANHPVITLGIYERLFSIAHSYKEDVDLVKASMLSFEKRHANDKSVRYWACRFRLMLDYKKCFTSAEIGELVSQHEERLKRLSTPDANGKIDVWTLESQCQLLADYYKTSKNNEDIKRVLNILEDAHKKCFDSSNPLQIMGILESLRRKYTYYGLKFEADRLLPDIQKAGSDVKGVLTSQEYSFTIPQEFFDLSEELFGKKAKSDAERWANFARYFIPNVHEEKKGLANLSKQYPLRYMIGTQMMDSKGRPQSMIGSYENDPDGNLVLHITEKLNFGTYFLGIVVNMMVETGVMTVDRIMSDIVMPCPLFEEDSYDTIRQSLTFFTEDKPSLFCHLLVPQLERAIRNLVENSGLSVIKPQRPGEKGFQLITLDNLLRMEPVEKAFSPDGALYLRLVLTDQRSLNIRNNLCHGILPPEAFHNGVALRLLHVLILIGLVR